MDESVFLARLPHSLDWPLYCVYADWLEDRGRTVEALAYRWMAANRKRPLCLPSSWTSAEWYDSDYYEDDIDPASSLPNALFIRLSRRSTVMSGVGWLAYDSGAEAVLALVEALQQETPA